MRQQDTLGLVCAIGLDRVRVRERLYVEVPGKIGDDGAEYAQCQLGAFGEAVLKLHMRGSSE